MTSTIAGSLNYYFRQTIGFLFSWMSPEGWYNAFDNAMTSNPETGYYMIPSSGPMYRYFMPIHKSFFLPIKRMPFDDIVVNVPNQPERHCEIEYGDWQRVPPENERWQHFINEIRFSSDD